MLKEKIEKTKKFVKEHKTEIIVGAVSISAMIFISKKIKTFENEAIAGDTIDGVDLKTCLSRIKSKNLDETIRLDRVCEIGYRSLTREESAAMFEREELVNYIAKLDHTKTINIFSRIPEKEKRISEIDKYLQDIRFDKELIEHVMEPIWGDDTP